MNNPNELSVTYTPTRKWLNVLLFLVVAVIGGARLYDGLDTHRTVSIVLGSAIIVLSIFGMLQLLRYRIIVTDLYVEQQSVFGSDQLMFTEMLQAKERKRMLFLYGPTRTLRIRSDIERFDEVQKKISENLNRLPTFRTEGNLAKWGIADRDDEGRLIRK